jgi:hypothetical protein
MTQLGRPGLSAAQKATVLDQWKEGQSLSNIRQNLGKHAGSIHRVVSGQWGIFLCPPPISLGSEHDGAGGNVPRPGCSLFTPANRGLSRKTALHRASRSGLTGRA